MWRRRNYWNLLDVIVVGFSLITLSDLSSLDVLKPTRAFRIFRLAGKVTQLRRIVNAVSQSVIPMANAFFVSHGHRGFPVSRIVCNEMMNSLSSISTVT